MNRLLLPLLFVAALVLPACQPNTAQEEAGKQDEQAAPEAVEVTTDADEPVGKLEVPSLRVETIDGQIYDLAERRGKWVVVNFWATWCAPCLKEMPELSALDAMREHVEVIGLAYEEIEAEAMRAFLEERPVVYPVAIIDIYDPPADFDTPRGLPMTYLIGPDGKIARQFLGPVSAHDLETAIADAGGPPVVALEG